MWLFNFFRVDSDGLGQRRLTTEDAEGTESCFFPCVLCALCGFPKPILEDNKKSHVYNFDLSVILGFAATMVTVKW